MAGMMIGGGSPAGAGYANQQCGEAKRAESKLELGLCSLTEQINRAGALSERLARVANRIAGSEPEPPRQNIVGANVPRPVESHLERLQRLFTENAEILERTARSVGRLEDSVG